MPVTIPVPDPTLATAGVLLLHVPPGTDSVNVSVLPAATVAAPPIGAGSGSTVTVIVALVPTKPYDIVTTPGAKPLSTNTPPTMEKSAIVGSLDDQSPPLEESLSVIYEPTHTRFGPVIG
jgi:hypothetical protein